MGYTTEFRGEFNLDRPLDEAHATYLRAFNETRRMKRDAAATFGRPDPIRSSADLPVGIEGGYFVGEGGFHGQDDGGDVVEHNNPPTGQPGLWCQWTVGDDNQSIVWDESEKFYDYTRWLEYIIEHFLAPWGYVLNGDVRWRGEEFGDDGTITVIDNEVSTSS